MNYADLHRRSLLITGEPVRTARAKRNQALIAGLSREDTLKLIVGQMRAQYAAVGGFHAMEKPP